MKKFVVSCPSCNGRMKIQNKVAKYRCPGCSDVYKVGIFKLGVERVKSFFKGIVQTIKDAKSNMVYKYNSAKSTYQYMSQLKKNMKADPNWSNYRNQQNEEKEMRNANKKSFMDIFKRKK